MGARLWLELEPFNSTPTEPRIAEYYARSAPPGSPPLSAIRDHVVRAFLEEARRIYDERARFNAALDAVQGAGGLVVVSRLLDDAGGALGEMTLRTLMRPLAHLVTDTSDPFHDASVARTLTQDVLMHAAVALGQVRAPESKGLPDTHYAAMRAHSTLLGALAKELHAIDDALAIAVTCKLGVRLRRAVSGARTSDAPKSFGRVLQKTIGGRDEDWVRVAAEIRSTHSVGSGWTMFDVVFPADPPAPAVVGLRAGKTNPGGMAWGEGFFAPRDRAAAERITQLFAKAYGREAPEQAKVTGRMRIDVVDFGSNFVRAPDGSLVERREGTWRATKWEPEYGDDVSTEFYVNIDVSAGKLEFKEKDAELRGLTLDWLSRYAPPT